MRYERDEPLPVIRPLVVAEAARVTLLIHCAFGAQEMPTDPPSGALRETEESIAGLIQDGGGACVMEGEDMIGAVLWQAIDGGLYFGRLAVLPSARGKGLARMLIAAAERAAQDRSLPRVHASVRLSLLKNRRLFATCGYHETVKSCHPGYSEPTTVAIEKDLSSLSSGTDRDPL